jgi:predicted small secreted protein
MVKKLLLALLLIGFIYCATGCQTISGLGRDVEWIGGQMGKAVE